MFMGFTRGKIVNVAKVIYAVVFHVSRAGVKVTAPALPGHYFTSAAGSRAEPWCKQYLDALLRLLRTTHKPVTTELPNDFQINGVFIQEGDTETEVIPCSKCE